MVAENFHTLTLKEQLHYVFEHGSLISTTSDADSAVSLYHLDGDLAELHYRINHNYSFGLWEIQTINLLSERSHQTDCFDKYLDSINLSALLAA
ncbi:hypothetical protein [Tellurirhabdus rosea]|uniref:hypothetical protein n=1 Tax=Tellurirhabdus rosea TaxID=2674997 RepID=UPI00224D05D3|nr:hypothetical protein [Tellurirhabdus rosea]